MTESGVEAARSAVLGERRRATRANLVATAAQVFHERGYVQTTVNDIVERATASRATFYLYFSSKQEIYRATAILFAERLAERFSALDAALRDADLTAFEAWLHDQADWAAANHQFHAVWREAEGVDPSATVDIWRATVAGWLDSMPWYRSQWPPGSVEPFTRLGLFIGQIQFFHHDLLADGERDSALRLLCDIWYGQLRARPTSADPTSTRPSSGRPTSG